MTFRPHGSAELEVQGQILIARILGPWNIELIRHYQQLMAAYVPGLAAQGPWALIIEITGEALCPADALAQIKAGAVAQAKNSSRICTSYVIGPDVVGHHVMDKVWRDIYAGLIPFEIFNTGPEALAWSEAQLAQHRACGGELNAGS